MAVESIPSTSNSHIHRDRLLCQICFKSAEKFFLGRDKFESFNMFKERIKQMGQKKP